MQCVFNAKSMPGCAVNQRYNNLFCEGNSVVKFRDGQFDRSINEVNHKAGNFHQIRWPGSPVMVRRRRLAIYGKDRLQGTKMT